jgi:ABC-2 type transport system permease protein
MSRILAVVGKDIRQISRNRFMAVITVISILAFAGIYYLMPSEIDETFEVGVYLERGRPQLERALEEEPQEGMNVTWADSPSELRRLVRERDVQVGFSVVFDNDRPVVTQYVSAETPEEIREAGEAFGREFGFLLAGRLLPVELEPRVIGPDRVDAALPLRDRLRILLLTAIVLIEVFALSELLAAEVRLRTVKALLVTPISVRDFLTAKGITGSSMAFAEGLVGGLLLRIIDLQTIVPVAVFLLFGALLVTALAFLIGAVAREMLSVIGLGTVAYVVLLLPGFSLILPGFESPLIRAIPTDPLIRAIDGFANQGQSLGAYLPELGYLAASSLVLFAAGYQVLRARLK